MISYNGAVITDLKEDKIIFEQMLTQDQIHELYEYSLKVKPISLRILTESSEWNEFWIYRYRA
jgi:hydroxymethylpyrimidine pyrophosphatase-like HAD family hydrolase